MYISTDPRDIYRSLLDDFKSIEQFNDLSRYSALYYQKHGSLDFLKIFIPNSNQRENGSYYLNEWSVEKAEQAANEVIRIFTKEMLMLSYLKEIKDDGIYLAFPTTSSTFLSFGVYIEDASYIIKQGRKNGIVITADEWLRDFPYEFHAAWYNRPAISKEISVMVGIERMDGRKLFPEAIYDGQQNWLESEKYPKIEAWVPSGEFTIANVWKWKSTPEEEKKYLEDFKKEFN